MKRSMFLVQGGGEVHHRVQCEGEGVQVFNPDVLF